MKEPIKTKVDSIHIESDINGTPTIVFTDEIGEEWVHSEEPHSHGGFITRLQKKKTSWYFDEMNKKA